MTPELIDVPESDRFAPGSRVRIPRDYEGDVGDGRRGGQYVIEEYVGSPDDETNKEGNRYPAGYLVEDLDGMMFGGVVTHSAMELVMSPAEHAKADRGPTPEELASYLGSAIMDGFLSDGIEVNETQVLKEEPGKNEAGFEAMHGYKCGVEFYGRKEDGRRFGAVLRLTALWETD